MTPAVAETARPPLGHPRGVTVARPRRRRRCFRHRAAADADSKTSLGGGAAATRCEARRRR